jgi:hypothetical protein
MFGEPMRRMALIAPPVQAAHVSDHGFGPFGLYFQCCNESVFGSDHEPVAFAFDADSYSEL